ncbi:MAG: UDP-N-acetylmuramate--L-alanine ligase [Acutalibacteraceae bacterium]|nr:UDP-N-acetylmuramate--L-alanine ligase [Acutalibacteraceae bacterium]
MLDTKTTDNLLKNAKKIHMIGIGGAGMYPIAQILNSEGYKITGSDNNVSDKTEKLHKTGIKVIMGHHPENVDGADLVIYSAAISKDNPELVSAAQKGIPTMERSYALGALTRCYGNTIGVCGTHGKTTVTSMITQILYENNFDPSAVIGGNLPIINSYGIAGKSDIFVCESCEYVDTFLKLSPSVAVVLNIDRDHMEYFKTLDRLKQSFVSFCNMAKVSVVNGDDENTMDAMKNVTSEIITFGLDKSNDYYADNIQYMTKTAGEYDLYHKGEFIAHIAVSAPGKHNIVNSLAAAATCHYIGATGEQIAAAMPHFCGAGRRFEILYKDEHITIADDYAHHPKELEVTLNTAMNMGYNKVIAVFQPFTYSRTKLLFDDFVRVLKIPDKCLLTEIMGSRETDNLGMYSSQLAEKIPDCEWFNTFEEIAQRAVDIAEENDLIITLGCGDIYKAANIMVKECKEKNKNE